jgi:hypothetical protein
MIPAVEPEVQEGIYGSFETHIKENYLSCSVILKGMSARNQIWSKDWKMKLITNLYLQDFGFEIIEYGNLFPLLFSRRLYQLKNKSKTPLLEIYMFGSSSLFAKVDFFVTSITSESMKALDWLGAGVLHFLA